MPLNETLRTYRDRIEQMVIALDVSESQRLRLVEERDALLRIVNEYQAIACGHPECHLYQVRNTG